MIYEDYLKSVDSISRNHISRVTIQIWEFSYGYNKKRGENMMMPKPYGTGILVSYMNKYFIFTAQHITKDRSEPLCIQINRDEFISIDGKVGMMDSTNSSGIDLAYIELDEHVIHEIKRIPKTDFLKPENIGFGGSIKEKELVVAVGFPELKTRVDKFDLSIESAGSIWLLNGASKKAFEYYEFDERIILGLNYHGKHTGLLTNESVNKIDPHGMSGGGVWKIWIESFMGEELVRFHLIGILTEYKKGKYHVLWANRIEMLIDFINRAYGFTPMIMPTKT